MFIYIVDKNNKTLCALSSNSSSPSALPFYNDTWTQYLNAPSTFEFTTLGDHKNSVHIKEGNQVIFKYDDKYHLFTIVEVEHEHGETNEKSAYCEDASLSLLNSVVLPSTNKNINLQRSLEIILENTDTKVGNVDFLGYNDLEISGYPTALEEVKKLSETFGAETDFRIEFEPSKGITGKYVDMVERVGKNNGLRFEIGNNVESVTKKVDLTTVCTAIIPVGDNDVTIADAVCTTDLYDFDKPQGQIYVALSEQERLDIVGEGSTRHIFGTLQCSGLTDPRTIAVKGWEHLQVVKNPSIEYTFNPILLGRETKIGDTVKCIDRDLDNLQLEARVQELQISFTDPSSNQITLGNYVEIESNISDDIKKLQDKLNSVATDKDIIVGDTSPSNPKDGLVWADTSKATNGELGEIVYNTWVNGEWVSNLTEIKVNQNIDNKIEQNNTVIKNEIINQVDGKIDGIAVLKGTTLPPTAIQSQLFVNTTTGDMYQYLNGQWVQLTDKQAIEDAIQGVKDTQDEMESLQSQLQQKTTELTNKQTELIAKAEDLEEQTEELQGKATELTTKQNELITKAGILETATNENKLDIENIEGQLDLVATKTEVENLGVEMDAVDQRVTQNTANISANATAIASKLDQTVYTTDKQNMQTSIQSNTTLIQQTAQGFNAQVEQLETTVNNIQIGGRNLIPNTDFDGVAKRYERLESNTSEGGFWYTPTIQIEPNTQYTLSAKIRGTANIVAYQIYETGGNISKVWITKNENDGYPTINETEFQKFTHTFTTHETKVFRQLFICTQYGDQNTLVGDWFEIAPNSLKLEEGNKSTTWTPAPEDTENQINNMDERIEQNRVEIEVNANAITSKVDQTVYTTDKQTLQQNIESNTSLINQTAQGINVEVQSLKTQVDNIQIGGRNLLQGSNNLIAYGKGEGITSFTSESGVLKVVAETGVNKFASFGTGKSYATIEDNLNEGDAFTISFQVKTEDGTGLPSIYIKSGMGYYSVKGNKTSNWSTVYYTGTWKDANPIAFHLGFHSITGTYYIRNFQIEKGNKPTAWKLAPEDMENTVNSLDQRVEQNSVDISINATNIASKVDQTIYTTDKANMQQSIQSNTSLINQTAQNISLEVQGLETTVNNIQIGGRNYLLDSKVITHNSNNASLYPILKETIEENGDKFLRVKRTNTTLNPTTFSLYNDITNEKFSNLDALVGKTVTLSMKVRSSHNINASVMFYHYDPATNFPNNPIESLESGKWKTIVRTIENFPRPNNGIRFAPYNITIPTGEVDNFYLDIKDFKVEIGNKATDWTPAPEDAESQMNNMDERIEQNRAGIEINANAITSKVEQDVYNLDKANMQQSIASNSSLIQQNAEQISQRVTSSQLTTAINNIEIGGRNLLKNTDWWYSVDSQKDTYWESNVQANKYFEHVCSKEDISGKVLTLSFDYEYGEIQVGRSRRFGIEFYCKDTNDQNCYVGSWVTLPAGTNQPKKGRHYTEIDLTGVQLATMENAIMYIQGVTGTISFGYPKLEFGNKSTAWTPAPEDTQTQIDALSTTVSNHTTLIDQKADSITLSATRTEMTTTINNAVTNLNNTINNISVGGRNLYIIKNSVEGYLVNASTTLGAMSNVRKEHTSEYIPVKEGEQYVFQVWNTPLLTGDDNQMWMAYQFYDASKNLVGSRPSNITPQETLANGQAYAKLTFTVPSGVAFLRVSAHFYDDGKIMLTKGNKAIDWALAPEDIEAVKGGRNLAIYSELKRYAGGVLYDRPSQYTMQGTKLIATNNPSSSLFGFKINTYGETKFTASGYTDLTSVRLFYTCYNASDTIVKSQTFKTVTPSNNKFVITIEDVPITATYMLIGIGMDTYNINYYVDEFMFEFGTMAHPFSPAPENAEKQVETLTQTVSQAQSDITANAEEIALRVTETELINYTSAKNNNLVTNGYASMKNNTNFPNFTYKGDVIYNGNGSFVINNTSGTYFTKEVIPVDINKPYKLSMNIKTVNASGSWFIGFAPVDIDGNIIMPDHTMYVNGSTTTLARELKAGDTVVYLTSVAGFNKTTTTYFMKRLIFWDYTNSFGYKYGVGEYSRHVTGFNTWTDESAFNTTNNTITLATPYTGATVPVGTSVSQATSGNNYKYALISNNVDKPTDWKNYEVKISGIDDTSASNFNNMTSFPKATAYIKLLFLLPSTGEYYFNSIYFGDISQEQSARSYSDAQLTTAKSEIKQTTDSIALTVNQNTANISGLDTKVANNTANITATLNAINERVTKTEFEALAIGGTNLLMNTKDYGGTAWKERNANPTTILGETYKGTAIMQTNLAWTNKVYKIKDLVDRDAINETDSFTLSFYARSTSSSFLPGFSCYISDVSGGTVHGETKVFGAVTTEWKRYTHTFKFTNLSSVTENSFMRLETHTGGNYFQSACYKLEKGTIATDFSFAPEDTELGVYQDEFEPFVQTEYVSNSPDMVGEVLNVESIQGNTLHNLADTGGDFFSGAGGCTTASYNNGAQVTFTDPTTTATSWFFGAFARNKLRYNLKANTTYTIIFDVDASRSVNIVASFLKGDGSGRMSNNSATKTITQGVFVATVTTFATLPTISDQSLYVTFGNIGSFTANQFIRISNVMVLEGDWTNKQIPRYFSGIKSVGDESNLIIKSTKKNMLDISKEPTHVHPSTYYNYKDGALTVWNENQARYGYIFFEVRLKPNKQYTLSGDIEVITGTQCNLAIYDKNTSRFFGNITTSGGSRTFTAPPEGVVEILFYSTVSVAEDSKVKYSNVLLEEVSGKTTYEDYSCNTVTIPELTLRRIPNTNVYDEITSDGKLIQRIGQTTLNGSEYWSKDLDLSKDGTNDYFYIYPENTLQAKDMMFASKKGTLYADFLKNGGGVDTDGHWATSVFVITISKTLTGITSADDGATRITKFETWLASNPITFVYELENPIVQDIGLPVINAYKNGHIICENKVFPIINAKAPQNTSTWIATMESANKNIVDGLESKLVEITSRVQYAEQQIESDRIISTVLDSASYTIATSNFATNDDIKDMATKEDVQGAVDGINFAEKIDERIAEQIDDSESKLSFTYVTQSQMEQTKTDITMSFQNVGGLNLIKNSLGFNGVNDGIWSFGYGDDGTDDSPYILCGYDPDAEQLGFDSSIRMFGKTSDYVRLNQKFKTIVGQVYTLSLYVKVISGGVDVKIADENWGLIKDIPRITTTNGYQFYNFPFIATTSTTILRLVGMANGDASVTGVMINIGNKPFAHTFAKGEIYNTNINFDATGIKVLQLDSNGNPIGYTMISPTEFAGYYDTDGNGIYEKIFYLNQDAVVSKRSVAQTEIIMGKLKYINLDDTTYKGWALVPSTVNDWAITEGTDS